MVKFTLAAQYAFLKDGEGHITDLRRDRHHSKYLQRVYNKYGESNISIVVLEYVESYEDLLLREQYYIDTLSPKYNGAAIAGSTLGCKHSEETKQKMSKAQTGKKRTIETKEKLRLIKQGSKCPNSKLTELEVIKIKQLLSKGYSQAYISSLFKVSENNISSIQRGEIWGHLKVEGFEPFKKREWISVEKIIKIKELLIEGLTIDSIAETLQVSRASVGNIKTGKSHSSVYVEGFDPLLTKRRKNIKNNNAI